MNIKFNIKCNLKFHHCSLPILGFSPFITTSFDDEIYGTSSDLILNVGSAFVGSNSNKVSQTKLHEFHDNFKNVQISSEMKKDSIYQKIRNSSGGGGGGIPRDSLLIFHVFSSHISSSNNVPCTVCVGEGNINVQDIYQGLSKRKYIERTVAIKNRTESIGSLKLQFSKNNFVMIENNMNSILQFDTSPKYDNKMIEGIIMRSASREYSYIGTFQKLFSGIDKMIDLFDFNMVGFRLPVSFLIQKLRSLDENGFRVLLYFTLRRYALENNVKFDFGSNKSIINHFSIIEKCSILTNLITLISISHKYNTDYLITKDGVRKLIETFQDPSKSDSGDCEDFAKEIITIIEAFVAVKTTNKTLLELQTICKMYIESAALSRTTVASLNLSNVQTQKKIKTNMSRKFISDVERWRNESQWNNMKVSAHMTVPLILKPVFYNRLNIKLRESQVVNLNCDKHENMLSECSKCIKMDGIQMCDNHKNMKCKDCVSIRGIFPNNDSKIRFEWIVKDDMKRFHNTLDYYRKNFDSHATIGDFPDVLICEGTGEFNGVNQSDPHLDERRNILNNVNVLGLAKYKIFHPIGDPEQFFLNIISLYTPYFIRHYGYPMANFIMSHPNKNGGNVYSVTYNDFIQGKGNYNILPMFLYNSNEMKTVMQSCKQKVRSSILKTNKSFFQNPNNLIEIQNNVNNIDNIDKMYDLSSRVYHGDIDEKGAKMELLSKAIESARRIKGVVNTFLGNRGTSHGRIANLLFTFKPEYFRFEQFISGLTKELVTERLNIREIDFFLEPFGETMRNIVLVITINKQ